MFAAALGQVICTKVRDGDKRIVRLKEGSARGRHVVIVDDLVQSGGTLVECQRLLKTQVRAPSFPGCCGTQAGDPHSAACPHDVVQSLSPAGRAARLNSARILMWTPRKIPVPMTAYSEMCMVARLTAAVPTPTDAAGCGVC